MTVQEEHAHAHGGVRSEEDRISSPRIVAVGLASLLLFAVSGAGVALYFDARVKAAPFLPAPPELGRSKIGMVEQQPFDLAVRGARDRAARLARLGSWGWVDRRAGLAHIPIDRAMALVEQGVRARAGGGQERDPGARP